MPLTELQVRSAKPQLKIAKLSDGGGLQLWVTPDGAKRWRLAYRFAGGQKLLAIGVYPSVGLKEARTAREKARRLLADRVDPSEVRKQAKIEKANAADNTFAAIAAELVDKKRREQKAVVTVAKSEWLLGLALPALGNRAIREIAAPEILAVLRTVKSRGKLETAKRLRATVGQVFRYAVATGRANSDPTGALTATALNSRPLARCIVPIETRSPGSSPRSDSSRASPRPCNKARPTLETGCFPEPRVFRHFLIPSGVDREANRCLGRRDFSTSTSA